MLPAKVRGFRRARPDPSQQALRCLKETVENEVSDEDLQKSQLTGVG